MSKSNQELLYFTKKPSKKKYDLALILDKMLFKTVKTYQEYYGGEIEEQCHAAASRSLHDCVAIAKTYLPGIKKEQVRKAVSALKKESYLTSDYCCDINRTVHWRMINRSGSLRKVRKLLDEKELNVKHDDKDSL